MRIFIIEGSEDGIIAVAGSYKKALNRAIYYVTNAEGGEREYEINGNKECKITDIIPVVGDFASATVTEHWTI